MAEQSSIEWTNSTWGPVRGCSRVSPGCSNCYAMNMAHRFAGPGKPYDGLTTIRKGKVDWAGHVRLVPEALDQPLRWKAPRRIFVASMSDLFQANIPSEYIAKVFNTMFSARQHTFQVLTKRADRMRAWYRWFESSTDGLNDSWWPLPNVWLGVSVEREEYTHRIEDLQATPAALRFLSLEPLLGPLPNLDLDGISWTIVGGESGPGARPMDLDWVRDIREQCRRAGVACFVKQLGRVWAREHLADPKGGDMSRWPEDLRVREMPEEIYR